VSLSFTSLPCAQDTGGENPGVDTQGGLKLLDCGRLGRQAAGHPWSALRVVKSCRKDCPTASVLPKPKQQLCIHVCGAIGMKLFKGRARAKNLPVLTTKLGRQIVFCPTRDTSLVDWYYSIHEGSISDDPTRYLEIDFQPLLLR